MTILPKIEKITRDATVSHFFLMFGYKLFSLYFPLFLVAKNFSLAQVGYTSFLIYLPIAFFAPVAGFLSHKINPALLASIGILGYGVFALGMILIPTDTPVSLGIFYLFQIILGVSASLFFVSSRVILMGSRLENPDRSFAWFYSAPSYADAIAPAVGALLIWKLDFAGVFAFSLAVQIFTAVFCYFSLKGRAHHLVDGGGLEESRKNYLGILPIFKEKNVLLFLSISFLVLILAGFNNTFFVLFLKSLGWSQNKILLFNSILSLIFLPISFWVIKQVGKLKSEKNISLGSMIVGSFSILLGVFSSALNFFSIFLITLGSYAGGLTAFSGRSGFLSKRLQKYPGETGVIDTIFSPLATAAGSLIGGLLIGLLGFPSIFIIFGSIIFSTGALGGAFVKNNKIR